MTASHVPPNAVRHNSLRGQFTAVIFALAFLPNLSLTLIVGGGAWNFSLTLWTLGVGAISALIGYVLASAMLEPLTRLRGEVERDDVAARGPAGDPSEVQALRAAFTGLLLRLSTEQARRGAFMATLVHDLKTPLIAVGHLVRLMMDGALSDAERSEVGEQMISENVRLLALVQQMADAHRFERDEVQLHRRPSELRPLLDALAARLSARAAERGLHLQVSGQASADVDAAVLERAVNNLADNALRYAASRVCLCVRPLGGGAELSITDDGPGLSEDLDTLAQPFNSQPTTIAGEQYTAGTAGLGLFIAKRIAQAHGGELRYERRASSPDSPASPRDLTVLTLLLPEVL